MLMTATFSMSVASAPEKEERPMHEIHSMMVYNFMKYVNWPPAAASGDFVIGVIGDDGVYETLTKYYGGKNKGSQKITIKRFDSAADLADCHVLYIGKSKSSLFTSVISKVGGKSTLIITDKSGLGKKGSGINFKTVDNKLKFELNQAAVDKAQLKISSQLAAMAIKV